MSDYDDFVRAELPGLLRYAVMLTGQRELAADVVQDVLVKAFRHWARIGASDHPDRYVLRMVTNQFLSWRRSWATRHIFAVGDVPDRPGGSDFGDTVDIGDTLAAREEMWQRLAGLAPRQRAVLVLRYYQQLTDAEIAEVLGCSATSVRGYAHRALLTLRSDLKAELAAEVRAAGGDI